MKKLVKISLTLFFALVINSLYAQQYQTIRGRYYNQLQNAVNCNCQIQGYVYYQASDGIFYNMTLCFDSEPGNFYQIYDGEEITVSGNVSSKPCANGKSYLVMTVNKSVLAPGVNRKVLFNAAPAKPATNTANQPTTTSMSGYFTLRGTTKDDWSIFDGVNCNACGRFDHQRNIIVNFDGIGTNSDALYHVGKIKVYGTLSGKIFKVSRWERAN